MEKENLEGKRTLLKLNTDIEGMNAIFRDYKISALGYLIENEEGTSAEVLAHIEWDKLKISRGSVINFLNCLVDNGFATFVERPGKGGYHRVYRLKERSWDALNNVIIDRFLLKLWDIFPDNERIKLVLAK